MVSWLHGLGAPNEAEHSRDVYNGVKLTPVVARKQREGPKTKKTLFRGTTQEPLPQRKPHLLASFLKCH